MGDPFEIKAGGAVWKVGGPTRAARDALTAAIKQAAWGEVEQLKAISADAYAEAKADFFRANAAGEFSPGARGWVAGTTGPHGNTLFLLSLLREHHPDATADDARALVAAAPEAVEAALAVQVPDFFALLADLPDTPGELRPKFREGAARARREAKTPPSPPPTTTP